MHIPMTTRVRRKTKLLLEGVRQVRVVAIVTHTQILDDHSN